MTRTEVLAITVGFDAIGAMVSTYLLVLVTILTAHTVMTDRGSMMDTTTTRIQAMIDRDRRARFTGAASTSVTALAISVGFFNYVGIGGSTASPDKDDLNASP